MEQEIIEYFSDYAKELRILKNISQNKLSKSLGIAQSSIARLEAGQNIPDIITLVKYSQYFNVSIDRLIGLVKD